MEERKRKDARLHTPMSFFCTDTSPSFLYRHILLNFSRTRGSLGSSAQLRVSLLLGLVFTTRVSQSRCSGVWGNDMAIIEACHVGRCGACLHVFVFRVLLLECLAGGEVLSTKEGRSRSRHSTFCENLSD
jgi:hypothetical protein